MSNKELDIKKSLKPQEKNTARKLHKGFIKRPNYTYQSQGFKLNSNKEGDVSNKYISLFLAWISSDYFELLLLPQ